jgi:hypothetical protein
MSVDTDIVRFFSVHRTDGLKTVTLCLLAQHSWRDYVSQQRVHGPSHKYITEATVSYRITPHLRGNQTGYRKFYIHCTISYIVHVQRCQHY